MSELRINLDALVEAGILSEQQKEEIFQYKKIHDKEESGNKFLSIFTSIGALITGIGIILFIAANWQSMNDMTKTFLLIGGTLAFYGAAYYYSYVKSGFEKTGQALMLVGALSYGASIFLLGQIYNVGGDLSMALLVWSLGVLPLAYTTRFSTLFILGLATLYGSLFSYIIESYSIGTVLYSTIGIALGFTSLAFVRFHKSEFSRFGQILTLFGGVAVLGNMILLTFSDFWRGGFWWGMQSIDSQFYIIIALLVFVGVLGLGLDYWKKQKISLKEELPFGLGIMLITGLSVISTSSFPESVRNYSGDYGSSLIPLVYPFWIYVIVMNILFLCLIALLIYRGIQKDNASLVNISIFFFAIYLFGKYIAFIEDSKLGGAFVFITGGLVCIAIGWSAEHLRRHIIKKLK